MEIKQLRDRASKVDKDVIRMKKYEEFLERVREKNADDFSEISDVHGRYKTLKEAYDNLIQRRE